MFNNYYCSTYFIFFRTTNMISDARMASENPAVHTTVVEITATTAVLSPDTLSSDAGLTEWNSSFAVGVVGVWPVSARDVCASSTGGVATVGGLNF